MVVVSLAGSASNDTVAPALEVASTVMSAGQVTPTRTVTGNDHETVVPSPSTTVAVTVCVPIVK